MKIRGIDHFKRIIDNIEKLKEIKNKHNSKNPDIRFDFVILKENYRCMVDLVLLAGRMNVKNIFFRPLQSVGISGDRQNELTDQMDYNDLYYYMKTAYKTGVANRINTNLGFLLNFFENFKSIYTNRDSKFENDICLLPWFQMFVSANGDTAPCCAIHSNIKMSMGNVLKDGLENVWNGKGFTDLRRFFKSKGKYDICRD